MSTDHPELSLGPQSMASVTASECSAIRLLFADGYQLESLARLVGVDEATIHRHAKRKCTWHAPTDGPGRSDS